MKKSKSRKKLNIKRKLALLLCLVFVMATINTGSVVIGDEAASAVRTSIVSATDVALADNEVDSIEKLPGVKFSSINRNYLTNGMMLIGAFLIHKDYMNDSIYNLAVNSMAQYNQPIFYYKSELAGGKWIDVLSASDLNELRGVTGGVLNDNDLNDYKVCGVIYSDGIMETVGSDSGNNIFSITNPYDYKNLSEISALATLYDGINVNIKFDGAAPIADGDKLSDVYMKVWAGRLLFGGAPGDTNGQAIMSAIGDGQNETTKSMDEALDKMRAIYSELSRNGYDNDYLEAMTEAMGQADSIRRSEIYYMLAFNGAGSIYDAICNRQYDKLMTKEQWADKFMANNWGSDWRHNDKWSAAIDKCLDNCSRKWATWSSVDYGKIERTLTDVYLQMNPTSSKTYLDVLKFHGFSDRYGVYPSSIFGIEWYRLFQAAAISGSILPGGLDADIYMYQNKIDKNDKKRYSIVYLASEYGWALSQAGDRIGDVKYWADRGQYLKAFNNYMSLIQRTNFRRDGVSDYTDQTYVIPGSGRLNDLLDRLQAGSDLKAEDRANYTANSEYIEAVKTAIEACEQAYYNYNALIVQSDNTVIGDAKYNAITYLVEHAKDGLNQNYLDNLKMYVTIKNVMDDIIADRTAEYDYIIGTLLPATSSNYTSALYAGPNQLYIDSVNEGAPEDTQKGHLNNQKGALDGKLAEYEFAISARVSRTALAQRVPYIDQMLVTAESLKDSIGDTAFKSYAETSVDEFIEWLNNLKKDILGASTGDSELDGLNSQKAAFLDAYLDALDEGDLDAAADYKNALDDLLSKIKDIQDSALNDFIDGDAAAASGALNKLGGTDTELANKLLGKAGDEIGDGDFDNIDGYIDALKELGDEDGLDKLKGMLQDAGADDHLLNATDRALKDLKNGKGNGAGGDGTGGGNGNGNGNGDGTGGNGVGDGNGNGDDNGNGNGNGDEDGRGRNGSHGDDYGKNGDGSDDLSNFGDRDDERYDGLNDLLDRFGDWDNMNPEDKAAMVCALFAYDGMDKTLARQLAMLLLDQLLSEGNPFVYEKYHGTETELLCVNLKAVDRCMEYSGFRYVLKNGLHTMSQTMGSASYMFEDGLATVLRSDGKRDNINISPRSQTDVTIDKTETLEYPYISKEDSETYLNVSCVYIPDTIYAILKTENMDERVQELLNLLEVAYGE